MVEDKNIIDKLCIDKVTKESTKSNKSNCDNARSVQPLIAVENSKEQQQHQHQHRPFQFGVRDGEKKIQEVTVIAADHNSLNANSTIDSRACYKPEKKQINELYSILSKDTTMTNSQLWFRGVRASKFRHVYGAPSRKENSYTDISVVRSGNDGNLCAVNPLFLAIVVDYAFVVIPISQTGRIDFQCNKVIGHSGQILDLKWNPFNDCIIASASDDCTIKIWRIPEEGLTSNLDIFESELLGHRRKVLHIEWHPTASNVMFSAGFDHTVLVWDVSTQEIMQTIDCHVDMIYSLAVNRDGSYIATTSKDKKLRVIEPRTAIVISEGVCHMGTKCSKVAFLDNGKVVTTGFSRHSDRQYSIWDQHDLKNPLHQEVMDSSSGVVTPYFDYDTRMLYLAGKGDGSIRYYEIVDEAPYIHYLNQFLSGHPQKALGFMPKRGLNTQICEIFRFYKLHAAGSICEPIAMIVPRRSTMFQNDLYPDTAANIPAILAKDWFKGRNMQPIMMSMVNKQPKMVNDITNAKYKQNEQQQQQREQNHHHHQQQQQQQQNKHQINEQPTAIERKFEKIVDSNYNLNIKSNMNGLTKHKDNDNKLHTCDNNNSKKFAFLAQQTIPDYRSQQLIEKSQKTSTNQSTKFHQLQAIFGHQGATIKDIANIQNSLMTTPKNGTPNGSSENLNFTENELRKAYTRQNEEIKNLKNQLANSEKRREELEIEVKRLQLLAS
ncbi:coronin-2B-like isoform X1 [Sitodiplosis mosellana]|uniref:coronin-2B-like isoform X1 n=1 Tax=Sitodiplosis mosellana TaxID=263140 RepID=UPI0024451757|nr:coronin-2B-like isoform X1 [Sitodiplosis mosellana]